MGNKWSSSPSFTTEMINDSDDGEPPDDLSSFESTLTVTFMESKNFSLEHVLGLGKHRALIRVVNNFNTQSYTKPLKFDNLSCKMPKRRFVFSSNDPEGEIRVSLLQNNLPPLPAVPSLLSCSGDHLNAHDNCKLNHKEKVVLAKMIIPISLVELKQMKHIDRWFNIEAPLAPGKSEIPQVRITLDFNYRPSRKVDSVDSLTQKYDIEDTIGTGVSVVKKAVNKTSKKEYAVKFLQKQVKGQNIPRLALDNEIDLLKNLSHANIVQLYETLEDSTTIYLIMELINGSDLFDISDILGTLRPASVAALLSPLLSALSYLHSRGIAHHDIKPENLIIDYSHNTLKLTDFGSAKVCTKALEGSVGGTLNYMAPEILMNMRGAHLTPDKAVDVWSIGILTYLLLSGIHPFESRKNTENILNRIIAGKFKFEGPVWEKVPKECKDFIKRCLVVDPKKRATVNELLKHPWILSQGKGPIFSVDEIELITRQKTSRSSSRSTSMGSLLELFSNEGVSRS
jgi:tRNA A-37 threonylcarbamoyl transferase component Bud32